ncbi:MAG TPA: DUF6800 family protein [Anaerolineae bacterium]|nr:DUF6800 family protein [Anaerolineae bacterium]
MKTRNHEINRRRARRRKTKKLKERIRATSDNKLKARLLEKLKNVNPFLTDIR